MVMFKNYDSASTQYISATIDTFSVITHTKKMKFQHLREAQIK